jgi:hypothetical protein
LSINRVAPLKAAQKRTWRHVLKIWQLLPVYLEQQTISDIRSTSH